MSDTYSIKFNHGASSFEIQGPTETWVDAKVDELKELMTTLPEARLTNPVDTSNHETVKTRKTPRKSTPKSSSTQKSAEIKSSLDWNDELATKILEYVTPRQGGFDKGATKQAAILAVFLKDDQNINVVLPQDMELIYRKLGWPTISHLNQLNNAIKRDRFFEKTSDGYELTHAGNVFGRDTSKTIVKDKK